MSQTTRLEAFAIDGLATYRLTRLLAVDTIMQPARARAIRWAYRRVGLAEGLWLNASDADWDERPVDDPEAPKFAVLVTCSRCVGVWCAAFVTVARWKTPRAWRWPARGLACAGAAVLIAGLERNS